MHDIPDNFETDHLEADPPPGWSMNDAPHETAKGWHTYYEAEPDPEPTAPAAPAGGGFVWRDGFAQNADYLLQRRVAGKKIDPKTGEPVFYLQDIAGPFQVLAGLKAADGQRRTRVRWRDAGRAVQSADVSLDGLLNPRSDELKSLFRRDFPVRPGQELAFCSALRRLQFSSIIRSVDQGGWHDLQNSSQRPFYVTASGRAIGAVERIDLASPSAQPGEFAAIGDSAEWDATVGRWAVGNPLLGCFISAALAAPLLKVLGESGGMLHAYGQTGAGKSTLLRAAASVWGRGAAHMRSWHATGNGLEALFANTHDSLVLLDEMRPSRGDADRIADVVFQMSNGISTGRMTKERRQDKIRSWTLLGLSTGEMGLVEASRRSRNPLKGGAEARCIGFPADAGAGHGIYLNLHGAGSDNAQSRAISAACEQHAGHHGPMFLQAVVAALHDDADGFRAEAETFRTAFIAREVGGNRDLLRVASKFALIAFAGDYATREGILPWPEGEAVAAASTCLRAFLTARGTSGSLDDKAAVDALEAYLIAHPGEFPMLDAPGAGFAPINGTRHSGWRRAGPDGIEYAIFGPAWGEILADHKPTVTAQMLKRAGLHQATQRGMGGIRARYHIVPDNIAHRYLDHAGDE